MHVPTEDPSCSCGEEIQTREHILRRCPQALYHEHRHLFHEASPELDLSIILGTKNGILALAEFIQASKAFTKAQQPQ